MSKQSRLNKDKAARAKASQDKPAPQPQQHDGQRNAQQRGDGESRKDDKKG